MVQVRQTILTQLIYLLLSTVSINSSVDVTDKLCEPGWVYNNGFCYFFSSHKYALSPSDAREECHHLDAAFASPETAGELEFMKSQMATGDVYGYLMNLKYSSAGYLTYEQNSRSASVHEDKDSVPEIRNPFGKDDLEGDVCIAFHLPIKTWLDDDNKIQSWFETVSCSTLLRVACKGPKSSFNGKSSDGAVFVTIDGDVVWVDSELSTYKDAKSICKKQGLSVIDSPKGFDKVVNASTYDSTPFWSSMTFSTGGLKWLDGSSVRDDEITWGPTFTRSSWVVLRRTRKAVMVPSGRTKIRFPYICKKSGVKGYKYGCRQSWIRGGRSCYKLHNHKSVKWDDAKKSCERQGAHLLTVDSSIERVWLSAIKFGLRSKLIPRIWTSGNDLTQEGDYRWHDGSVIDNMVFPWRSGTSYMDNLETQCTSIWLNKDNNKDSKYIRMADCTTTWHAPACQYTLKDARTTQCASGWKEYKNICYYLDDKTSVVRDLNENACSSKRGKVGAHAIRPLQVKTFDVYEFLAKEYPSGYYWLGLDSKNVPGKYLWMDDSVDDMSNMLVPQEPDNGRDSNGKPQNCVSTDGSGYGYDRNCDSRHIYICEINLPELTDAIVSDVRSGNEPNSASFCGQIASVVVAFVLQRFIKL